MHNLTFKERQILNELASDCSIIITPADKGGGVVFTDEDDYQKEILRQLGGEFYYEKIKVDLQNISLIKEGLALNYIDTDTSKFLLHSSKSS